MKKLLILLMLFAFSCSKQEQPTMVTVNRYASEIKYTNKGEPDRMYWYVYEGNYPDRYVASTSNLNKPFEQLEFWKEPFPVDVLKSGSRLDDVQISRSIVLKNKGIKKP